ncbi:aspartyl protease family protein [Bordetella sp. 15P40C-2]|uniref:aspartyl protease family protein n=1 Tax=Bordetella sp. 15P40C-2 TaxID=2572246 RepID=UPI0013213EAD|nr:aspartyl protease family protein [Bordetella sp. 15P40C-2]MVW71331.1 hypothetical protein [Bordetella sp. 15P40C-2]
MMPCRNFVVWMVAACASLGLVTEAYSGCGSEWVQGSPLFSAPIEYDDPHRKSNPTVRVFVDGSAVKMMLDTGASSSLLWDASIVKDVPEPDSNRVDSHVGSSEAKRVGATLADHSGHALSQEFFLVSDSVLSQYGYSGILSPQQLAGDNRLVVDLLNDCLIVARSFDVHSDTRFALFPGRTLANSYGVMAIPLEIAGGRIPVIVDTGASVSSLLASLVKNRPQGAEAPRAMDVFGSIMPTQRMRLVNLKINGKEFRSHPVIPRPTVDDRGITDFGYIGMDILKNLVIYHDGARGDFSLLVPRNDHKRGASSRMLRSIQRSAHDVSAGSH